MRGKHQMTALSSLPTEILSVIFEKFCRHCQDQTTCVQSNIDYVLSDADRRALYNLCLTCRAFHDIARPVMLHRPYLAQREWLSSFVKFIRKRPDMAIHVKQICGEIIFDHDLQREDFLFLEDTAAMLQLRDPNHPPFASMAMRYAMEILIASLPRIECLVLRRQYLMLYDTVGKYFLNSCSILEKDDSGSVALPFLRMLTLQMYPDMEDVNGLPGSSMILKNAPNLEHLVVWHAGGFQPSDMVYTRKEWQPELKKLKVLDLRASQLKLYEEPDKNWLCNLIDHSDSLNMFRYWNDDWQRFENSPTFLSAHQVLDLLIQTRCHLSLTHLDLNCFTDPSRQSKEDQKRHLGKLISQFPNLKTLKLDEQSFCQHWLPVEQKESTGISCITSILPGTVHSLVLRAMLDGKCLDDLLDLSDQIKDGNFPHLRRLGVELRVPFDGTTVEGPEFAQFVAYQAVLSTFKGSNVQVILIPVGPKVMLHKHMYGVTNIEHEGGIDDMLLGEDDSYMEDCRDRGFSPICLKLNP